MTYTVTLDDQLEKFLDWYLREHPMRPEHKREDYPHVLSNNFIRGMRERMMKDGKYCERCEEHKVQELSQAEAGLGG